MQTMTVIINERMVTQALRAICELNAFPASLFQLSLVQHYLVEQRLSIVAADRAYALMKVLLRLLQTQYQRQLLYHDLSSPPADGSVDDANQFLRAIAQRNSKELWAWTVLYYRYGRYELDFSFTRIAQTGGVHPRTLRRYHTLGIRRLTHHLIDSELQAQAKHNPSSPPV